MWSGALESSGVLLLYPIISLASPMMTIILISTLNLVNIHIYLSLCLSLCLCSQRRRQVRAEDRAGPPTARRGGDIRGPGKDGDCT